MDFSCLHCQSLPPVSLLWSSWYWSCLFFGPPYSSHFLPILKRPHVARSITLYASPLFLPLVLLIFLPFSPNRDWKISRFSHSHHTARKLIFLPPLISRVQEVTVAASLLSLVGTDPPRFTVCEVKSQQPHSHTIQMNHRCERAAPPSLFSSHLPEALESLQTGWQKNIKPTCFSSTWELWKERWI